MNSDYYEKETGRFELEDAEGRRYEVIETTEFSRHRYYDQQTESAVGPPYWLTSEGHQVTKDGNRYLIHLDDLGIGQISATRCDS